MWRIVGLEAPRYNSKRDFGSQLQRLRRSFALLSPSKGGGPRGHSHSVRSPSDNNKQLKSHSFARTDGLHLALNVLQYQRVEGATILERRDHARRRQQSGKVAEGESDIDKASTVHYSLLRSANCLT